jgi:hypothetical protein
MNLASESVDSGCGEEEAVPGEGIHERKGNVLRVLTDASLLSVFALMFG